MLKYFLPFLTLLFLGCSSPKIHKHPSRPKPTFKVKSYFDSCKFKKVLTVPQLVSVAFFTNCGIENVNIFAVVIYDPQNMPLAGLKAAEVIRNELKYKPTLGLIGRMMISDKYGVVYPFLIFVQTGRVIK